MGLDGGEHFWRLPDERGPVDAALQADLHSLPSGRYDYQLTTGILRLNNNLFNGSTVSSAGNLLHVNSLGSSFGSGWGLAGWQELVENPDGTVLLIDGDGSELLFEAPLLPGEAYPSPPGDFSTLEKLADGTFRRTLKDRTVYTFNARNQLEKVRDRNSNETRYLYNSTGNLSQIIDSVVLETLFTYTGTGERVTAITDPAGRVTQLEYDGAGNLRQVIDPDDTSRKWEYDSFHHMTAETDKQNFREEIFYDNAGRADRAIRKDGSELDFDPIQVQGLSQPSQTTNPPDAPVASGLSKVPASTYIDANGNEIAYTLDRAGQMTTSSDEIGSLPSLERNSDNLVTRRTSSRNIVTDYIYDERGNLSQITDYLKSSNPEANPFPFQWSQDYSLGGASIALAAGDLNGDRSIDLVSANALNEAGVFLLAGEGEGTLTSPSQLTHLSPRTLALGDLNSDGYLDLVMPVNNSLSVRLGGWDGLSQTPIETATDEFITDLVLADLNGDGWLDAIAGGNSISTFIGIGDGTFTASETYSLPGEDLLITHLDLESADLDGDGNLDLAVVVSGSGYGTEEAHLTLFFGQGNGSFSERLDDEVEGELSAVGVGDLDSDGDLDLVTSNRDDDNISLWSNQGGRSFVGTTVSEVGNQPSDLAIGDVNTDGHLDVICTNEGESTVSVLAGNGDGTFTPKTDLAVGSMPTTVILADLDTDGDDDLISANYQSRDATVWLNGNTFVPTLRSYTYDPFFNQMSAMTDELGRQTLYDIDPNNGNVLSITQVIGTVGGNDDIATRFTYTSNGLVDTMTDPLGRVMDNNYDPFGRLISMTYAVGTTDEATREFEYDDAGNQTAIIDENGNRTEFEYDSLNRLIIVREADPDGNGALTSPVTTYTYDAEGNLLNTTDAEGNVTTNEYDTLNRLVETTDSLNQVTTFTYDAIGNIISVVDPLGNETKNVYDERNRLIRTIDPDNGITQFNYDLDNNLTSVIDPVNNQTTFVYDARSRLVLQTDPLGKTTRYQYDAVDNLMAQIDRNDRRTEFEYDDIDRLIVETWVGTPQVINYTYDKASNLTSVVDNYSSLAFSYDNRDRVNSVDNLGTPNAPRVLLKYTYDDVGNMLSVVDTINGSAGGTNSYNYDSLNRLTNLTQSGHGISNKRVDFGYNALGQFTSINRYSNLAGTQLVTGTAYTYDTLNRLSSLTHNNSTTNTAFYNYGYDASSRITRLTDIDGVINYSYDDRNQLTGSNHSNAGNPDETYTYDANGNRTNTGYQTGTGNRLTSDGTYNYQYDDEGNLTRQTEIATGEVREFSWDYRNRLVAVVDKDAGGNETQRVEFTYDALDRRIAKAVGTPGIAPVQWYVYNGDNVYLEFADNDGISGANQPTLSQRYLHGLQVDQILAQEDGNGNVIWMLTDHLGTVRDLVDDSGTVINHLIYDSFGRVIDETDPSVDTRYLYTGREFDEETGLYYYRARYYNAATGRFIGEDPTGFNGGDANLYRYVGNSPIVFVDPSGLITFVVPGRGGEFGNLPGNIASGANYNVVPIPNAPIGSRALNAIAVAAAAIQLQGGLSPGEPINIIAHSDGNQTVVGPLATFLKGFFPNAEINVGRLDPTFVGKPPFFICNTTDFGSNKPFSLDPRNIAGFLSPVDVRADFGLSHMDLLNDPGILRKLRDRFRF